jgi:ferredoxin
MANTEINLDTLAGELLTGPDLDFRIKTARTLVKIGSREALELLRKAMDDRDETFRARLVKVIARLDHPLATEIVIKAFNDPDCYVRKSAVEAVSHVDHPDIIRALVDCLRDEEINVRESAVIALEKSRDADMVVNMLSTALTDSHWNVRRESVEVIARVGGSRAFEPLRLALKDKDPEVRLSALVGLADLADEGVVDSVVGALTDPDVSVQLEALDIAGKFGRPVILPLLEEIGAREGAPMMIKQAAVSAQNRIRARGMAEVETVSSKSKVVWRTDGKSVQVKPVEVKPAEVKPIEVKPAGNGQDVNPDPPANGVDKIYAIDPKSCIRCASCSSIAPTIFRVAAKTAFIKRQPHDAEEVNQCEAALGNCPTGAISSTLKQRSA